MDSLSEIKGELCDVAKSLISDLVTIGMIQESQVVLGKPFPLVLVPKNADIGEKLNFIQLQEYL